MNLKRTPLVSVVMPTYNAGIFLRLAIDSILNQTYQNIELIIVNDFSNDKTAEILNFYKRQDKRIKVITNRINLGVSRSANIAISEAKGQFIARMDSDDMATSDRIEKQVNFLNKHKKVVAVGGQCELIDKDGEKIGAKKFPSDYKNIKSMVFSSVPIQQPTLMINKGLLPENFVWYDNNFTSAEELELIFKLFKLGSVRNLKSIVLKYRIHPNNTSLSNPKKTFFLTLKTRIKGVLNYGYVPTLSGILNTILQIIFVGLVPNRWIYPVYMYVRGMRKFRISNAKINLDVFKPLKKVYQLAQN